MSTTPKITRLALSSKLRGASPLLTILTLTAAEGEGSAFLQLTPTMGAPFMRDASPAHGWGSQTGRTTTTRKLTASPAKKDPHRSRYHSIKNPRHTIFTRRGPEARPYTSVGRSPTESPASKRGLKARPIEPPPPQPPFPTTTVIGPKMNRIRTLQTEVQA